MSGFTRFSAEARFFTPAQGDWVFTTCHGVFLPKVSKITIFLLWGFSISIKYKIHQGIGGSLNYDTGRALCMAPRAQVL